MKPNLNILKSKIFNRKGAKFSFSQAGEDLVLQRIFLETKRGFFVDVGAYHPYRLSNTFLFYLNGWTGINIEPRPGSKKLFDKFRPLDINLELGISVDSGVMNYRSFPEDTHNQFEFAHDQTKLESKNKGIEKIAVEPLSKILENNMGARKSIDFLTIDTEGAEYAVLKSNNWIDYAIHVVLVEQNIHNKHYDKVVALLKDKKFKEAYRIPVNPEAESVFYLKD